MKFFKYILTTVVAVAFIGVAASAQENKTSVTVAVTAGADNYAGVSALDGCLPVYSAEAPSSNWMTKGSSFGAEMGILFGQHWRLVLGGGFNFAFNPGYNDVPGTVDPNKSKEENWGGIPGYESVPMQQSFSYLAYVGSDYCFTVPAVPALKPYLGLRFSGAYASNQKLSSDVFDMGISNAETFKLRAAFVAGADYYFGNAFFVGIALDAVNYTYSVVKYQPQQGLRYLAADAHNIGAIAMPTLKIGVKF